MKTFIFIVMCYSFLSCNGMSELNRYSGYRVAIARMLKTGDLR